MKHSINTEVLFLEFLRTLNERDEPTVKLNLHRPGLLPDDSADITEALYVKGMDFITLTETGEDFTMRGVIARRHYLEIVDEAEPELAGTVELLPSSVNLVKAQALTLVTGGLKEKHETEVVDSAFEVILSDNQWTTKRGDPVRLYCPSHVEFGKEWENVCSDTFYYLFAQQLNTLIQECIAERGDLPGVTIRDDDGVTTIVSAPENGKWLPWEKIQALFVDDYNCMPSTVPNLCILPVSYIMAGICRHFSITLEEVLSYDTQSPLFALAEGTVSQLPKE